MNRIFVAALKEETQDLNYFHFTGVGKINAAMTAAKLIERYQPKTVWNFGTAGGIKLEHGCHEMVNFVERDKGKCPEALEVMLPKDPITISLGVGYTCSTGDNFVTDPNLEHPAHVVDMEAFAIAKACRVLPPGDPILIPAAEAIPEKLDENASDPDEDP